MRIVFKSLLSFIVVYLLGGCASNPSATLSRTSEALQHDLDIVRLQDLQTLSDYVERYRDITGRYPLQGQADVPHYVHIATQEQQQYAQMSPPYAHVKTPAKDFVDELVATLGNDIEVPFDLQRVPVNKPNFYIYMITGKTYFLAVHVHQDFPFANKVADFYNKVEITNGTDVNRAGTWQRVQLLTNPAYISATHAQPHKPGYTEQVRESLGGNSAF